MTSILDFETLIPRSTWKAVKAVRYAALKRALIEARDAENKVKYMKAKAAKRAEARAKIDLVNVVSLRWTETVAITHDLIDIAKAADYAVIEWAFAAKAEEKASAYGIATNAWPKAAERAVAARAEVAKAKGRLTKKELTEWKWNLVETEAEAEAASAKARLAEMKLAKANAELASVKPRAAVAQGLEAEWWVVRVKEAESKSNEALAVSIAEKENAEEAWENVEEVWGNPD